MPSNLALLPQLKLQINGSNAAAKLWDDLADCTIENSLHLPDACTLRFYDDDFEWLDAQTFSVGDEIQISASELVMPNQNEQPQMLTIFKGEVTGFEVEMAQEQTLFVVRCYNRAHRLHRGRQRRSFLQMTDSDIVTRIAAEAGCTANTDTTSPVHNYVFQNNQTNWEFLSERAAHNGCRLYVTNNTQLNFKKVTESSTDVISLEWGESLRLFRPRLSAGPQVDKVTVRGWDPITKQAIIGQVEAPLDNPQIGLGKTGKQVAAQGFSQAAEMFIADRPVHSQTEAEQIARSVCDDIGGEFIEAEGMCDGNPALLPGKMVQITNIGTRFSGKYFVTSTTHTYAAEGYQTVFSVSGKRAETMLSLLERESIGKRAPLGGNIVIGLVTNNKDPDGLGRVKVKFPWLCDSDESDWARMSAPMAGSGRGFYYLPEVNDEVLVAFEHGDVRRPFILGALWNGVDKPMETNDQAVGSDGKVNHRIIKTRIGHTVLFDDTDGLGEMKMTTANSHILTLDDANKKIEAKTKDGHILTMDDQNQKIEVKTKLGHKVTMDDMGQKIVIVDKNGTNKMTISSIDNSMKLECMGNFTVDAKGKVSIQGLAGVDVKTPAMLNVEGTAMTTVKSTAMVIVQGGLVKIN